MMIDSVFFAALWFCALGCGLMAGIYFAFSAFIMTALARIPQSHGVAAMQSINRVIQRSLFMVLFVGTTLVSAGLVGLAVTAIWGSPAATVLLAAGIIYVGGMFVCTMVLNVPLNNALDAVDPAGSEATPVWQRYLTQWTFWNHVRAIASTIASALYIIMLCGR
jgi:uncharacterized membrane protein